MLVAVYAYENIFQGLHGMCSQNVIEVQNLEEAEEYAIEESINIINDYPEIFNQIQEDVEYEYEDYSDEEYEEILEAFIHNDIAFEIYEITKETTESIECLDEKFYNNPEEFIKEYCQEEN